MIRNHHRMRGYTGPHTPLVEACRKADWIDVSFAKLRFGIPRRTIVEVRSPSGAHLNALVGELLTEVLALIADRCEQVAAEVGEWGSTRARGLDSATRDRFERMVRRHGT